MASVGEAAVAGPEVSAGVGVAVGRGRGVGELSSQFTTLPVAELLLPLAPRAPIERL